MLIANQFNRQEKYLRTGEMPLVAFSRTAVDADIQGHLAQHLKSAIYQYLKTDTLLYKVEMFADSYEKLSVPMIQIFKKKFQMKIEPSETIDPPVLEISQSFKKWIDSLNNWELVGFQTMAIWMKSTIAAYNMIHQCDSGNSAGGNNNEVNNHEGNSNTVKIQPNGGMRVYNRFSAEDIQKAAYLQQTYQMQVCGQVEERIMDINQIKLMLSCGELFYRLGKKDQNIH